MGEGLNPEIYEDDTDPDCRPWFRRSTTDCACMIPRMKDKSSVSRGASLPSTLRWAHPDIVYIDFLSLFGTMNGVIYTANILGDPSVAGDWSMFYEKCHRTKISLSSRSRNGVQIDRKAH